ncbi:DUF1499 domain-containing protein [Candidatus Poseidoniales archaeon]|nr:DUF1499 domain-containing protein [Candidatus Poseidoniales archaeon]MDA8777777.1 DUF1499 domain-containing protein [Candidatus Poseidoniales archaeon]MDB2333546.1 DUF1499 domain-containing protein [Candidatus Poseidoniales archaeon]MDB2367382.1 DUF1499 domain-containing protein [Candidatus Poseidoniales archaeon]|tara:strand:+ start:1320 stop:1799 length:480 start_codon:yes stop_codon:yes gene_type:complete
MNTSTKALIGVLLLLSPWLLVQAWILAAAPDEAIEEMPSCSESSSNCAHLGGGDYHRMEVTSVILEGQSLEETKSLALDYIDEQDGEVLFESESEGEYFVHFVEHTSFWLFPDDVVVSITADGANSSKIELHSESRLGAGDLGVNPERLELLYDALASD